MVPSKKRTCAGRPKPSPVEKLTKDLCTILHEQQSCFSVSSEDDLLFESEAPMVSVEIGHGSILIRHPSSIAREEESEASSLSVDNKQCLMSEAYSCSGSIPMHSDCSGMNSSQGVEKVRNSAGKIMQQEQLQRHVFLHYFVILHFFLVSYARVSLFNVIRNVPFCLLQPKTSIPVYYHVGVFSPTLVWGHQYVYGLFLYLCFVKKY